MLVRPVMDRLDGAVPDLSGRIEGAASLTALVKANALPPVTPAAHVVPLGLRGHEPAAVSGLYRQVVDESVSVLLTVRSYDRVGDAGLDPVDALVPQIIAALCGWQADGTLGPLRLVRGGVASLTAGALVYQLDFSAPTQLRIPT